MKFEIDPMDRMILAELQRDGTLSVDQLSERVSLSRNACWRRVKLTKVYWPPVAQAPISPRAAALACP
jgi:DNA-binding Lrp family transcriptional regulator